MALGAFAKKTISKTLGVSYEQITMAEELANKLRDKDIDRDTAMNIWAKVKNYDVNQINDFLKKVYDVVK